MAPDMPNGIWNTATTTMKAVVFKVSGMGAERSCWACMER
jgi:hypothetical protein